MNKKKDLGLYIHIPFCERKCNYCDFLSAPADREAKAAYVEALIKEIKGYEKFCDDFLISTIFIGGGTPTTLEGTEILRIMKTVKEVFGLSEDSFKSSACLETTIEANPGTLTKEKLYAMKEAGINRISMGLQSTKDKELKLLGRIHTYDMFLQNYHQAREAGFQNINIDLMSALPGQTKEGWSEVLKEAAALRPEHISAYSLIIEEGTPFYERYKEIEEEKTEEAERQMYWDTAAYLKEKGYGHYEISNYAKEGYECRHNTSYWIRKNYLGLGLGAASLINNTRYRNETDLKTYILHSGDINTLIQDKESLSIQQQMEEYMFLGLRLIKGVRKADFEEEFHTSMDSIYAEVLNRSQKEGLLVNAETVYLTEKGIDLSNMVMARFLL